MFDTLSGNLSAIFERLGKRGALGEGDVDAALSEVRVALLEADVALAVVKDFIVRVKARAIGAKVLKSVSPGQMVIKVVHEQLTEMLGQASAGLELGAAPAPILLVGLQGSGKTTTCAKIGLRLKEREKRKVLMASLDVRRPAAQEQLRVLGRQCGVDTLPIVPHQAAEQSARRALEAARLGGYDVVLLDTAGRLHIDEGLMAEMAAVRKITRPTEVLLVADALTGQDAVKLAAGFHERLDLSGIVLTRVDGDGRGGAALSMRAVTGCPIKLMGVGEKLDELEAFHPERVASRILGMGDVVSLVEKAAEATEEAEAEKLAAKIGRGQFDLDDLAAQLRQMRKMGGADGLMGLLPGVGKVKRQLAESRIDEGMLARQEAIVSSMTPPERRNAKIIGASRKRRIAAGSGTSVPEVNRLLKQHKQMAAMMKRMNKLGKRGLMRHGLPGLPLR